MRAYFGSKLSDNITQTSEGYIICHDVPLSRTGKMVYRASELGLDGDGLITVVRSAKEVFDPQALASFEGKAFTDDHPPVFLDSSNTAGYQRGHIQNIRKGPVPIDGEWVMLGDIVVTEANLISRILNKVSREISAGYTTEYTKIDDSTYEQSEIRGNHAASVVSGRAGPSCRIRDHAIELQDLAVAVTDSNTIRDRPDRVVAPVATNQQKEKPKAMAEKAKGSGSSFFARMFTALVKDGAEPEELERAVDFAKIATERAEKQAGDSAEEEAEKKKQADRKAKDAAEEEEKKLFKEKEKEEADKKAKDAAAAEEKAAADKKVKDEAEEEERKKKESEDARRAKDAEADGTELHPKLKEMADHVVHMRDCMDSMMDHFGVEKKSAESKDEGLIPMVVEPEADRTKNPIPGADSMQSVRDYLNSTRREVAQSRDMAAKDKWNKAWIAAGGSEATKSADTARGGKDDGYSAILHAGKPEHTRHATQFTGDSMIDNEKRMDESVNRAREAFEAARKKLQGVN